MRRCVSSAIAAPSLDEWIAASSQTAARRQDITLADPLRRSQHDDEFGDRGASVCVYVRGGIRGDG